MHCLSTNFVFHCPGKVLVNSMEIEFPSLEMDGLQVHWATPVSSVKQEGSCSVKLVTACDLAENRPSIKANICNFGYKLGTKMTSKDCFCKTSTLRLILMHLLIFFLIQPQVATQGHNATISSSPKCLRDKAAACDCFYGEADMQVGRLLPPVPFWTP